METKFGTAYIDSKGYYAIKGAVNGKRKRKLHRLIFEDFYNVDLSKEFPNFDIHHVDGNKTNNEIWNLDLVPHSEHQRLHKKGTNMTLQSKLKLSKVKNKSMNYFRVTKKKEPNCKQGFRYCYRYKENRKEVLISSVDFDKLKEKVLARGLPWQKLNTSNSG